MTALQTAGLRQNLCTLIPNIIGIFQYHMSLTLVLLNQIGPVFANSIDPTDLDLHCLPFSM